MKNQNLQPKQKTTNGGSEQLSVTTPQLSKLSVEELNKVNAGVGPHIIHIG
ncbi:MAG: hypothetical protein QNJ51_20685 [Calothrix sp. MO_167.B12]|nr:hypothetical protein [Calothrix sp. MO_167.B12]